MAKRQRRSKESGSVRKLPSGKWQARVHHADGTRTPLGTFATKRDADQALTLAASDQMRGQWVDPRKGRQPGTRRGDEWRSIAWPRCVIRRLDRVTASFDGREARLCLGPTTDG